MDDLKKKNRRYLLLHIENLERAFEAEVRENTGRWIQIQELKRGYLFEAVRNWEYHKN